MTLTKRQWQVVRFVARYHGEVGISPTLDEIGEALDLSRVTIKGHVDGLVHKGAFTRVPHISRSIALTRATAARVRRHDARAGYDLVRAWKRAGPDERADFVREHVGAFLKRAG